ncbi:MAG: sarcosine oxidase subunit delta [Pseudorhodobacter sp.]
MRLTCPLCGPRDRREFHYYGAADYLARPAEDDPAGWDAFLHLRDNPAGETRDLWYHETGCAQWLLVTRNTVTHAISDVVLVAAADASGGGISAKMKSGGGA